MNLPNIGGVFSVVAAIIAAFSAIRTAKINAKSGAQTKEAVDGSAINTSLWQQWNHLQSEVDAARDRIALLERVVDSFCYVLRDVRGIAKRVVEALQKNQPVAPDLVSELEAIPTPDTIITDVQNRVIQSHLQRVPTP